MRKVLAGALAGLTLIGGQAVAAGASQPLSVGDRVGATAGESRNALPQYLVPAVAIIAIIGGAIVLTDDDDGPRSGGG